MRNSKEEMLYDFFAKVAPVATVRVVRDTKTLESEHHGYLDLLKVICYSLFQCEIPSLGKTSRVCVVCLDRSGLANPRLCEFLHLSRCREGLENSGWCSCAWSEHLGMVKDMAISS